MKKIIIAFLAVIFMLIPNSALADSEVAPHSYKEVVGNNKFVFVMVYPGSPEVKTEDGKGLYNHWVI